MKHAALLPRGNASAVRPPPDGGISFARERRIPAEDVICGATLRLTRRCPSQALAAVLRAAGGMAREVSHPPIHRLEVLIGRTLAACIHPLAAWRHTVRSFRLLLVAGYFAAGYVGVLAAMLFMK